MRKYTFILLLTLFASSAFAQRLWLETEIDYEITKNLEAYLAPEIRFKEQLELKEYFLQGGLEYSFNKYFQLGAGYRFGYDINKNDEHESFGRFNIDAKTEYKWNRFNPEFRLRFTNADDFADDNASTDYLRYKLVLKYDIKKWDLKPYIAYEWYQNLDAGELDKARFETGLNYKINKHHRVGAYYRTNNYLIEDKDTRHIIGISYKFKL